MPRNKTRGTSVEWTCPAQPNAHVLVLLGGQYLILPQSERSEGLYQYTGNLYGVSKDHFLDVLEKGIQQKQPRPEKHFAPSEPFQEGSIEAWEDQTTWAEILEPRGFRLEPGMRDTMGGERFTRDGGSPGSVSAYHDRYGQAGIRLHVWSDKIDGLEAGRSHTMLQTYAALNGLAVGEAMDELGITKKKKSTGGKGSARRGTRSLVDQDSDADSIYEIVSALYHVYRDVNGSSWYSDSSTPHILKPFAVKSSLAKAVASISRRELGHVVRSTDVTAALSALEGDAMTGELITPPAKRVLEHQGRIYIDIADERNSVLALPDNAIITDIPEEVRFYRTTDELELHRFGTGDLKALNSIRDLVKIRESDMRGFIAWLVSVWVLADKPSAILSFIAPPRGG